MLRILSMYLLSTCMYSLEKFIFILLSILIDYYYWIVWVLYIFWILILYPVYGLQIFSPIQRLPFHWLVGCVAVQKIYSLMVSHLFIFYFVTVLLASYPKKSVPTATWMFFPMLSSRVFTISDILLKSLINFELIFVTNIGVQFHFSACDYPVFLIPLIEETILSPLSILGSIVNY